MNFGDRILYNDNNNNVSKGVFIKELNQVEVLIKLDDKSEKSIVSKHCIKFVNNMDNMDLTHAIAVADYISKYICTFYIKYLKFFRIIFSLLI